MIAKHSITEKILYSPGEGCARARPSSARTDFTSDANTVELLLMSNSQNLQVMTFSQKQKQKIGTCFLQEKGQGQLWKYKLDEQVLLTFNVP